MSYRPYCLIFLLLCSLVGCDSGREQSPKPSSPVSAPVSEQPTPVDAPKTVAAPSEAPKALAAEGPLRALSARDYSYGYWLNGMRKLPGDDSAEVLCFETGHYGFSIDLGDFSKAGFSRFGDELSYMDALATGVERMQALDSAQLEVELESRGTVFRAVSSKTGSIKKGRPQVHTRMWESGRLVQRYDLLGLNFVSADGRTLGAQGILDIVAWPERLALTAQIAPSLVYKDGWTQGVVDKGLCVIDKPWKVEHDPRIEHKVQTVELWVKIPKDLDSGNWGYLLCKNKHEGVAGHYSFVYNKGSVTAKMNFGPGVGLRSVNQRGHSFKVDAWNHLALTYDGNEMCYYLNGKLQGTEAVGKDRPLAEGNLSLGQRADGGGHVLAALFDQVRVWRRVLSAQEIQEHAASPERLASTKGLQYEETFDRYSNESVQRPLWKDVTMRIRLKTKDTVWEESQVVAGEWPLWDSKTISLHCDVTNAPVVKPELSIKVHSGEALDHPVVFDTLYNAYGVEVRKVNRSWDRQEPRKDGYDDYHITVTNSGDQAAVAPLFFDLYDIVGITGASAMLCDADGRPTGIPVQLSKNWHDMTIGQYIRCFASLPIEPGQHNYILRLAYGFYGTLPAASHAQLSLIGWGNHGRWDQLAIGSWGETICFDTDMSCVDLAITDVRMLMARNGADGKAWGWTDAGWGGDWLGVFNTEGKKLATTEMKAGYIAQGPCLTDVRFDGHYGASREVALRADTATLRTDDFARTFFKLRYDFDQELPADKAWLFKVGRVGTSVSPQFAYGNRAGLIESLDVPVTLTVGQSLLERFEPTGEAPWWAGFPGGFMMDGRDWGTGSRALIIRSYKARFGGVDYGRPTFATPIHAKAKPEGANLNFLLTPPVDVLQFQPGDFVEMEVEFMTFHRVAEDYYGPNEHYRKHLEAHPRSWKTIHREAIGNALQIEVAGGELLSSYPIRIRSEDTIVDVTIQGGNGKVPLSIEGMPSVEGYHMDQIVDGKRVPLDQSVVGNDFWQTDYDLSTKTYRMTFNLPLDEGGRTRWVLSQRHNDGS